MGDVDERCLIEADRGTERMVVAYGAKLGREGGLLGGWLLKPAARRGM